MKLDVFGLVPLEDLKDLKRTIDENISINLRYKKCDYHSEFSIRNESTEDLQVIDSNDTRSVVRPSFKHGFTSKIIIEAAVTANRNDTPGLTAHDPGVKGSDYIKITFPVESLYEGPVYVPEINRVICLREHVSRGHHPFSESAYQKRVAHLHAVGSLPRKYDTTPFTVLANDPHGKYKKLYFVVGNQILSTHVQHYKNMSEHDNLTFLFFKEGIGQRERSIVIESFENLCKNYGPDVWEVRGIPISHDPTLLKEHIRSRDKILRDEIREELKLTPYDTSMMIHLDDHKKIVDESVSEMKQALSKEVSKGEHVSNEALRLKNQNKVLTDKLKDQRDEHKAEMDFRTAELKDRLRIYENVTKILAVSLPVVIAAYRHLSHGKK